MATLYPVTSARLALVPYDRKFLTLSTDWLSEPETQALTMTPTFTHIDQERFFDSLPDRADYHIWGVAQGNDPIGAGGIKNIADGSGEYWGYIGPKHLWGLGLGTHIMLLIEQKAINLHLRSLFLRVSVDNIRALRLYEKNGYTESGRSDTVIFMHKDISE